MSTFTDVLSTAVGTASSPVIGIVQAAQGILSLFKMDPTKKAELQAQLTEDNIDAEKAQLAADLATAQGQLAINLQEAKNDKLIDDWRDAVGWTCATALFWNYVAQPFVIFGLIVFHVTVDQTILPKLDMVSLMTLLGTMLGTGASQFHLNQGGN